MSGRAVTPEHIRNVEEAKERRFRMEADSPNPFHDIESPKVREHYAYDPQHTGAIALNAISDLMAENRRLRQRIQRLTEAHRARSVAAE